MMSVAGERGWRARLACWMNDEHCHNSSSVYVCERDNERKGVGNSDDWRGPVRIHRLEGRLLIFNNRFFE